MTTFSSQYMNVVKAGITGKHSTNRSFEMKELFPEYYKGDWVPSHDKRWDETAFFVFDSNILLNLYGFRRETRNKWFEAMEKLEDRVFLPYQAAVEYHRKLKAKIESVVLTTSEEAKNLFDRVAPSQPLAKYHPLSSLNKERESISKDISRSKGESVKAAEKWTQEFDKEKLEIREKIASIFVGKRIGTEPAKDQIKRWCELGQQRYANKQPPGYKDQSKGNNPYEDSHKHNSGNMYGDLIIWQEILLESQRRDAPAIFVSAEKKPDWTRKDDSDEYVARHELATEFLLFSGNEFEFAHTERFYRWVELRFGKVEGADEEVKGSEQPSPKPISLPPSPTLDQATIWYALIVTKHEKIVSRLKELAVLLGIEIPPSLLLIESLNNRNLINLEEVQELGAYWRRYLSWSKHTQSSPEMAAISERAFRIVENAYEFALELIFDSDSK